MWILYSVINLNLDSSNCQFNLPVQIALSKRKRIRVASSRFAPVTVHAGPLPVRMYTEEAVRLSTHSPRAASTSNCAIVSGSSSLTM